MPQSDPRYAGSDNVSSFTLRLSVESSLFYSDESEYITQIDGSINCDRDQPDGTTTADPVGSIRAIRIYGGRAFDCGESLWDICDAHSQDLADLYQTVFGRDGEFRSSVKRMFPDASSPDLLLIDKVRLGPQARGRAIGLRAARRVMDLFEPEYGLVVVKPFPLQFEARYRDGVTSDADLETFTCDERTAFQRIRRYWSRLGFRRISESAFFVLCPLMRNPTFQDLEEGA